MTAPPADPANPADPADLEARVPFKVLRLLTPDQAVVVARLHRLGLFQPLEIARMVDVPLERIHRSFRLTDQDAG